MSRTFASAAGGLGLGVVGTLSLFSLFERRETSQTPASVAPVLEEHTAAQAGEIDLSADTVVDRADRVQVKEPQQEDPADVNILPAESECDQLADKQANLLAALRAYADYSKLHPDLTDQCANDLLTAQLLSDPALLHFAYETLPVPEPSAEQAQQIEARADFARGSEAVLLNALFEQGGLANQRYAPLDLKDWHGYTEFELQLGADDQGITIHRKREGFVDSGDTQRCVDEFCSWKLRYFDLRGHVAESDNPHIIKHFPPPKDEK